MKAVKVGGVAPSEATVKDGTYAIQRPFVLATKTDAKLNDVAQAFFDYVTSADANDVITAAVCRRFGTRCADCCCATNDNNRSMGNPDEDTFCFGLC